MPKSLDKVMLVMVQILGIRLLQGGDHVAIGLQKLFSCTTHPRYPKMHSALRKKEEEKLLFFLYLSRLSISRFRVISAQY
jgi:hypothetical protein